MSNRTCKNCGGTLVKGGPEGPWIHTTTGNTVCDLPRKRAEPEPQLATSGHGHHMAAHSSPSFAEEDHGHEELDEVLTQLRFKLVEHNHDTRYVTKHEALRDSLVHVDNYHTPSYEERKRRKVVKGWATGLLLGALAGPPLAALLPWDIVARPPLWVLLVVLYLWGMLLAAAVAVVVTGGRYPENLGRSWVGPYYGRLTTAQAKEATTRRQGRHG